MKKIFIIAAVAALCISLTGCNKDTSGPVTATLVKSKTIEDVSDGTTTLTTFQWAEDGAPAGEKQTVDRVLAYEDSDYQYSGLTVTCTRTYYLPNGDVDYKQKLVTEYTSEWYTTVKSQNVYKIDETGTPSATPATRMKREFSDSGRLETYEYEVDGKLMLKHDNYTYTLTTESHNIWDYSTDPVTQTTSTTTYISGLQDRTVITSSSGEQIEYTQFIYSSGYSHAGYKKYKKIDGGFVLDEAQTDYSMTSDYTTESYNTIWYEDDGTTPRSKVSTTRTYYVSKVVLYQ